MASSRSPLPAADELLHDLLDVSLTGVILFRPVYDAAATIQDFTYEYLNPAAQRLLELPERPAESFLTRYPSAREEGIFAFYAGAFASDQTERYDVNYQHDGLDGYFHLVARRSGERLVVSFTDTNDQPRSKVEEALRQSQARERQSQARERQTHQEADAQRQRLLNIMAEAPALMATLRGPDHVFEVANARFQAAFGTRQLVGRSYREVAPELAKQGIFDVLDAVYRTGETYSATEAPVYVGEGPQRALGYYNFIYQATHDAAGQPDGILNFAYNVTEQVLARQQVEAQQQQVQQLNEELAATNEELQASNEEYLRANTALSETQQQLRQLNEELEARVQQRTQELAASHQATEALQAELLATAQRQVQERESLYQIFEQTPAIVLLLRAPNHRMEYVNPACVQLFGGRSLRDRLVPEGIPEAEAQGFVALLDQVYQTGDTYLGTEVPLTVAGLDGQPATTYLNFSYQAYREQDQIAGVSVFAYDVTPQVLARQQREAQQRLVETVFAQAPVAIWVTREPNYVFELVNPLMAQILGRPPAELLGRPYVEALPAHGSLSAPALLARAWQGEVVSVQEYPLRVPDQEKEELRYFSFVIQPLWNAQGQLDRLASVAVEVTDQVLARQQVQDLNQELAAINEELTATNEELHESNTRLTRTNADLDNFVYTASHDLKSPISNIEGLLALLPELLPEAVRTDAHVAPVLDRMQESIERFRRTITHLTDVSRLQAEFAQPAETVALAAVIEDVRQDLYFQFLEAGAVLEVAVNSAQPRVFSPKNLRSLVYNLLSNALKYRHPERAPLVRISCQPAGDALVLTVQDNGLGLSAQQQQRLFQLFQRLHTHVEGSGVGLYAVKKIVENAGGTITVASQPDVGTTFSLTFPA